MKKFKLILLIFSLVIFLPFIVNAETCNTDKISISSISLEKTSGNTKEKEEATANGKNINLNLSMSDVGDSIKYKVVVNNESNEDYELDSTSFNLSPDYIDYSVTSEDDSYIIKANSSMTVYLTVKYAKEVPDESFESGTYNGNQIITVQLYTGDTLKNPNTGNYAIFVILLILIISGISFIVLRKKKYIKFMILIMGIAVIIPISVYALCKTEIKIESNINIIRRTNICPSQGVNQNQMSIGDEISIGEEEFYVIKKLEDKTVLLSKYCIDSNEGKQSQSNPTKIAFSSNTYWNNNIGEGKKYNGDYDPSTALEYPYVYDENSRIYEIINRYVNDLSEENNVEIYGRLLSKEEAEIVVNYLNIRTVSGAGVYWLGSFSGYRNNIYVFNYGEIKNTFTLNGSYIYSDNYREQGGYIRPVIIVNNSDIMESC